MEILDFANSLTQEQLQTAFKIVFALLAGLSAIVIRFIVNDYISHRKQIHSIRDWLARTFEYNADE